MGIPQENGRTTAGRERRRERRRGGSLVELLGALTLLTVGLNASLGGMVHSTRQQQGVREASVAMDAIETVLEQLQAVPFEEVFARFNARQDDDVGGGLIGSPGAGFDAPPLQARPDSPNGRVGRIEFPGNGLSLREDAVDPGLGMPRDLDGDGVVDGEDHAGSYRILPVRVVVEWQGSSGPQRQAVTTTLSGR
jgi:hypothetical protein